MYGTLLMSTYSINALVERKLKTSAPVTNTQQQQLPQGLIKSMFLPFRKQIDCEHEKVYVRLIVISTGYVSSQLNRNNLSGLTWPPINAR